MNFLLQAINFIGGWLTKLAPYLFAYKAGEYKTQYDFEEALAKVLREDNEELRKTSVMPDAAIGDSLRERAARKARENKD